MIYFPKQELNSLITLDTVVAQFARWSVFQAESDCPVGLESAVTALKKFLLPHFTDGSKNCPMIICNRSFLYGLLRRGFNQIPQIENWVKAENILLHILCFNIVNAVFADEGKVTIDNKHLR